MKPNPLNILLIEDEEDWFHILKGLLEQGPDSNFTYELKWVQDLSSAIPLIGQNWPQVILLDWHLPDSKGLEALKRIRSENPAIPVIIATVLEDENLALESLRQGAHDYLVKGSFDGRTLAKTIQHAHAKTQTDKALARRAEWEQFITSISNHFSNLSAGEVDPGINIALKNIGDFCSADRVFVCLLNQEQNQFDNTHEWCAEGIHSLKKIIKGISVNQFPWLMDKLRNFEVINIPQTEELPAEARKEKDNLISLRVQSLIGVPISCGGNLIGFMGMLSQKRAGGWDLSAVGMLKLVSEMMVGALERKKHSEKLNQLLYYDHLTGFPNRALFMDRLNQSLIASRRNHNMMALMILDLDQYARVISTVGHEEADALLKDVADRVKALLGEVETITRLGGDVFTILLPGIMQSSEALKLANKILGDFRDPYQKQGHNFYLSCSMGITFYPNDGHDAEALLKNANTAMSRAKQKGRSQYQLYASSMNAKAFERMILEDSLRHALERDEFRLHYQPQIDLKNGKIIGLEALIRWMHPSLGMISPNDFIPLAEETGLIVSIGEWVLRQACLQNVAWQNEGLEPVRMAVNLSAKQFERMDMVRLVTQVLEQTRLNPEYLDLELTEGAILKNPEEISVSLRKLSRLGIRLAIDDFGTGYWSLSYLKFLPVDTLKLDRSFVSEVTVDNNSAAIAKAVISMAHNLKLDVIAEGVETNPQKDFLVQHDCDKMQGFLFSKPLPVEEISLLLTKL